MVLRSSHYAVLNHRWRNRFGPYKAITNQCNAVHCRVLDSPRLKTAPENSILFCAPVDMTSRFAKDRLGVLVLNLGQRLVDQLDWEWVSCLLFSGLLDESCIAA